MQHLISSIQANVTRRNNKRMILIACLEGATIGPKLFQISDFGYVAGRVLIDLPSILIDRNVDIAAVY